MLLGRGAQPGGAGGRRRAARQRRQPAGRRPGAARHQRRSGARLGGGGVLRRARPAVRRRLGRRRGRAGGAGARRRSVALRRRDPPRAQAGRHRVFGDAVHAAGPPARLRLHALLAHRPPAAVSPLRRDGERRRRRAGDGAGLGVAVFPGVVRPLAARRQGAVLDRPRHRHRRSSSSITCSASARARSTARRACTSWARARRAPSPTATSSPATAARSAAERARSVHLGRGRARRPPASAVQLSNPVGHVRIEQRRSPAADVPFLRRAACRWNSIRLRGSSVCERRSETRTVPTQARRGEREVRPLARPKRTRCPKAERALAVGERAAC